MLLFMGIFDGKLTTADGIWGTMLKALRSMFFTLNEYIYKFIYFLYSLFEMLCNGRLLNSADFAVISTKIGFLLGIIMLFKIVIDFIGFLVEPDKLTDSNSGATAVVKKVLIVIVMLGASTFAFEALYQVQNYIINEKILYKLVLPSNDVSVNTKDFGKVLSARVFTNFYTVEESILNSPNEEIANGALQCSNYRNLLINEIVEYNSYAAGSLCLNSFVDGAYDEDGEVVDAFYMDYNFLLQTLAGIGFIYLLISYVVKVGVRMFQLTFLQILSPMAIISYLSPKKDNMFSKWTKIYFDTYIDVFIRVLIIYFAVYLSSILLDTMESGSATFWDSVGAPTDITIRGFVVVIMIFALLTFAKKAPDLVKELLPASASKLGFGANWKDIVGLNKAIDTTVGVATGATVGLIGGVAGGKGLSRFTGAFSGLIGGGVRGGHAGFGAKGLGSAFTSAQSNQAKANLARAQRIASGATFGERVGDSVRGTFGMQASYAQTDSTLSVYNNLNSLINDEDIVKDYANQREEAARLLAEAESKYGTSSTQAKSAREFYSRADGRLGAAKEAVFQASRTGATINTITYQYTDSTGTVQTETGERTLSAIKSNASTVAAIQNVERVAHKTYTTRSDFNTDRKRLQAESQTRHKNGS